MEKGMRWFLICLTAYFVVVHLSGILQLYQLSVPLWIHIAFFIVDQSTGQKIDIGRFF